MLLREANGWCVATVFGVVIMPALPNALYLPDGFHQACTQDPGMGRVDKP